MKKIFPCLAAFLILPGLAHFAFAQDGARPQIPVRVCIVDDSDKIHLTLKSPYRMFELNSDRLLDEGPRFDSSLRVSPGGFIVGKKDIKVSGIRVKVSKDSAVYIDGRRFRGEIDIARKENRKLMVINTVGVEDYLYGVLYHEVSHRWPVEALKAQAIAARTYALFQKRQNALQPFDLKNDIYSQMYGGRTSEKKTTTEAVDLTRDKVLVFRGGIFPSYYHATCAGHTEDASNLWNIDLQPLKGVACFFCANSPHYKWDKDIPLWEMERKLRENGYKTGSINSVEILSKNISGRVDKLMITDNASTVLILTAKDFRQMMGPNNIRSTRFDIAVKWGYAILTGHGWGHGVGMCQWGAYGMAQAGRSAEEILKYYYPGAEIAAGGG
jgi:stage II sporulation protein D